MATDRRVILAGGWTAITFLFITTLMTWPSAPADEPPFTASSAVWALVTLAVMATVATLAVVAAKDAAQGRDDLAVGGLALGVVAWLFGGLVDLFLYEMLVPYNFLSDIAGQICGGSGGAGTFECVNRPGSVLEALGVVSAVSATPVAAFLLWSGRRSRLCAHLTPVIIFGAYLLALRLWQPHEGLGVPVRPIFP